VAEPAARVADEVEADDLEDPLALPEVDIADVPELLDEAATNSGLLGHLTESGVRRRLAFPDEALGKSPHVLAPARPDRGEVPGTADSADGYAACGKLSPHEV